MYRDSFRADSPSLTSIFPKKSDENLANPVKVKKNNIFSEVINVINLDPL